MSEELVDAAREMPYRKSSRVVTNGAVSSQTVMNKIRRSSPRPEVVERVRVPVLHVDADEDHVKLHNGNSTYAPLISVYTGIEKQGKRGICKDVFHISEYGMGADDLWETALNEMERRYDLSDTKIYLHGDGAPWIKAGLGWLPNCMFVLDRYHVNKALQESVSGMDAQSGSEYRGNLLAALREGNEEEFLSVREKCWRVGRIGKNPSWSIRITCLTTSRRSTYGIPTRKRGMVGRRSHMSATSFRRGLAAALWPGARILRASSCLSWLQGAVLWTPEKIRHLYPAHRNPG